MYTWLKKAYTNHSNADNSGVDATLSVLFNSGEQFVLIINTVHCGAEISEEDDPTGTVSVLNWRNGKKEGGRGKGKVGRNTM